MEAKMFRKVALDRLSSPEQIDEVLRVIGLKEWVSLGAMFLVLTTIIVWSVEGTLPTKATGQGVIVRTGGVLNVVTMGGGSVLKVGVKVGDKVRPNEVVARIAQPALIEKINAARQQLVDAEHDREWALQTAEDSARLQIEALKNSRVNAEREITELENQAKLAAEQIPLEDQLFAKGLVTKQQTITVRQKLASLQAQAAERQALIKQYDAQQFVVQAQPHRTDTEKQERIRDIKATLASLENGLSLAENVTSPYSGEVIEMKVDAGSVVEAGAPVLAIQPDVKDLEVLVYVPSQFAKTLAGDMEAEVSPATIKREEYGFIRGKVVYVANYPATPSAIMRNFHNESLVQSLTSSGPVTEMRVEMQADEKSVSGYRWSSSQGPPTPVSSGTICSVDVITLQQHPIALLLPYVKKQLSLN